MSAPKRIWLQDAGDYDSAMSSSDDVTWCVSPMDDRDTEYIRADLPRPQDAARIAELEAALERIAAMDRRSHYRCGDLSRPMHVDGPIGKIARASLAADSGAADA